MYNLINKYVILDSNNIIVITDKTTNEVVRFINHKGDCFDMVDFITNNKSYKKLED